MSQPQPIASTDVRQRNFETLYAWLIKTIGERRYSRVNNILEFGCGKGGFIDLYRRPGQSGFAIDLHDYSEHYPQDIRFLLPRADGCIPLVDQSIDLIVSHSVVEHLTEPAKVFADLNRVLKVGGLAFISVSPLYFSPTGSHMRHLPD
ncbi:MAG: class I SAM-dependent methyltransferase, partial [Hyphomonadaceae bacterium]